MGQMRRLCRLALLSTLLSASFLLLLSHINSFNVYRELRSSRPLHVLSMDSFTNNSLLGHNFQVHADPCTLAKRSFGIPHSRSLQFDKRRNCWATPAMTVVTGFFNIGPFRKGTLGNIRDPNDYLRWLRGISALANPVLFFTDDQVAKNAFESWRSRTGRKILCSQTYMVSRQHLWPWQLLENITEALQSQPYTPSPPCTTSASYNAATNCKYPLTELAILLNPFESSHFAWFDAGIFRDPVTDDQQDYYAVLPLDDLAVDQVAYLEFSRKPNAKAEQIFLRHTDWIAGGVFFGSCSAMLALSREYSEFARFYMARQLVGADQQVLAAMFAASDNQAFGIAASSVSLRLYNPFSSVLSFYSYSDPWFHLAFMLRQKITE